MPAPLEVRWLPQVNDVIDAVDRILVASARRWRRKTPSPLRVRAPEGAEPRVASGRLGSDLVADDPGRALSETPLRR
jgi:hypothetical protein